MSDNEVLEALWAALEADGDIQQRLEALDELESWADANDPGVQARMAAVAIGAEACLGSAIRHALVRLRRRGYMEVHEVPEQGKAEVAAFLESASPQERMAFVDRAESKLAYPAALVLAARLLNEDDRDVAHAMARVLGMLGTEPQFAVLEEASRHESSRVRLGAVEGLAFQRGHDRTRVLVERLGDKIKQIQNRALEILNEIPRRDVVASIERIPDAERNRARKAAVVYLQSNYGDPRCRELLLAYMDDADPRVASQALIALAGLGEEQAHHRMLVLENHPDPRFREIFQIALNAYNQWLEKEAEQIVENVSGVIDLDV